MRTAEIKRRTKGTDISIRIDLDGSGKNSISTGIGFFDHMLTALCVHGGFDFDISVNGDLEVARTGIRTGARRQIGDSPLRHSLHPYG